MALKSGNLKWYSHTNLKFYIVRKHSRKTMEYETVSSPTHQFVMCFTFDVMIAQYCEMSLLKTNGAHGKSIK